jgi:hypothetical protein
MHVLDIGSLLESSERLLNVSFDALGKLVVRLGDAFDCTYETCPRRVEDAWEMVSMTWVNLVIRPGQLTPCLTAHWGL